MLIYLFIYYIYGVKIRKTKGSPPPSRLRCAPRMAPASSNCSASSLSDPRCQALIAVEQGEGSRRSTGGFAPRSVGTLLSCASSSHGRITQALDLLVPRWLSIFLRCYSCCFCGSLVWSTAQPTRLMVSDLRNSPSSMAHLVYCYSSLCSLRVR